MLCRASLVVGIFVGGVVFANSPPTQLTALRELKSAMRFAVYSGNMEYFVTLLQSSQIPLNSPALVGTDGRSLLHVGIFGRANRINTVKTLLSLGHVVSVQDDAGVTPVHQSSAIGDLTTTQLLLHSGANIDHKDYRGNSAVTLADLWKNNPPLAKFLRDNTKNHGRLSSVNQHLVRQLSDEAIALLAITTKENSGQFLDKIEEEDRQKFIRLALEQYDLAAITLATASPNLEQHHLDAFLHRAIWENDIALILYLLEKGASPNAVHGTHGGNTLHTAAESGLLHIADLLINNGARDDWHNKDGALAVDLALARDDIGMARILLRDNVPKLMRLYYERKPHDYQSQVIERPETGSGTDDAQPEFLINLNQLAREGKLDPAIARDGEMLAILEILGRRRKNNPILLGEAGVGKSAIVEGLATKIVAGDVPEHIRDKTIYSLDVGALTAGTMFAGAMEERLQELIHFFRAQDDQAILFIDEVHQIVGRGGATSIANFLKAPLARGELHCIGATTNRDYQRFIIDDPALERRFMPVPIEEPSEEDTVTMLSGVKNIFEDYHGLNISKEAIEAAVRLSRNISDRNQPDKSIDLIDAAAASLQFDSKRTTVRPRDIARVVSKQLKIPIEKIMQDKQQKILQIGDYLKSRIFGQNRALDQLTEIFEVAYAGINDPNRPLVSVLLKGPTGVGKTETAIEVGKFLFDSNDETKHLIRIDLSEYSQEHEVAKLTGAPPGYVGYDDGGVLTSAVKANPYAVILFDEIDKAHPTFFKSLLQILGSARLTDGHGNTVDFRNTIIVLTTNTEKIDRHFPPSFLGRLDAVIDYRELKGETINLLIDKELAELNERLQEKGITVTLGAKIIEQLLAKTNVEQKNNRRIGFEPDLPTRTTHKPIYGARQLKAVFSNIVSRPVARLILRGKTKSGKYTVELNEEKEAELIATEE